MRGRARPAAPTRATLVPLLLLSCAARASLSLPEFGQALPNAGRVTDGQGRPCAALGHAKCVGGGDLNAFGKDFAAAGYVWTAALCQTDSDGDGLTNGEELGDPCCTWRADASGGALTKGAAVVSHPGVAGASSPAGLVRASPELCGAREGGRKAATLGELLTGVRAPGGNATHFALDFRPTPFPVPDNQTTTYGSIEFNLPDDATYDVVAIEPLFDGAAPVLHHFDFSTCVGRTPVPGRQVPSDGGVPGRCGEAVYVWTNGTAPIWRMPADAGLRFGAGTRVASVRVGTHYHNPAHAPGLVDAAGVRLHVTTVLRPGAAAMMWTGPISTGVGAIPPGKARWYAASYCRPQLDARGHPGGVSVFAFLPHMHKLGSRQFVELFRPVAANGSVTYARIASLGSVHGYSYAHTHYVTLDPPVAVLPGDVVATTCVYDSRRANATVRGGLGSDDEMCIGFLSFHPEAAHAAGRHCEGIKLAGELPPGAASLADVEPRLAAPVDWHLELQAGRLKCDTFDVMGPARTARTPSDALEAACGAGWRRLANGLRRVNGTWAPGLAPPSACTPACAAIVYNWLACSTEPRAMEAPWKALGAIAGMVEPVADAVCGHHLLSGAAMRGARARARALGAGANAAVAVVLVGCMLGVRAGVRRFRRTGGKEYESVDREV